MLVQNISIGFKGLFVIWMPLKSKFCMELNYLILKCSKWRTTDKIHKLLTMSSWQISYNTKILDSSNKIMAVISLIWLNHILRLVLSRFILKVRFLCAKILRKYLHGEGQEKNIMWPSHLISNRIIMSLVISQFSLKWQNKTIAWKLKLCLYSSLLFVQQVYWCIFFVLHCGYGCYYMVVYFLLKTSNNR